MTKFKRKTTETKNKVKKTYITGLKNKRKTQKKDEKKVNKKKNSLN